MKPNRLLCFLLAFFPALALHSAEPNPVQRFHLPNGLTVLVEADHSLPLVNVTIMYRVGSVNERPGITGIAHYVEHMNFRATQNISKADITGAIERIGGRWNGYTSLDQTLYAATVPAWALEAVLNTEAERMARTLFDPEEFQRERSSVIAELQGYQNDPSLVLWDQVLATSFELHPYRYNIIGWLTDVESITRDEAHRFYRDYYGPNNAVLAVVGDVEPGEVRALVEKHFGALPPATRSPLVRVVEPPQRGAKRTTLVLPGGQARLLVAFRAPAATDPDFPKLLLLDAVLAGGRPLVSLPGPSPAAPASRLQEVVAGAGGSQATTALTPTRFPYVYAIGATAPDANTLDQIEAALEEELARVKNKGVSPDELAQARERLTAEAAFEASHLADRGHRLAYYEALGSWELAERILKAASRVSSEDLQSFVRRWLAPHQRTVGRHLPGELAPAPVPAVVERPPPEPPAAASPVPPAALDPVPAPRFETVQDQLPNGVKIRAVRREGSATSLRVRLGLGSALDPPGREGLAMLVARLLTSGPALESWLYASGARLTLGEPEGPTPFSNREYIDVSLRFRGKPQEAIAQLAKGLQAASFSRAEIERARQQLLEESRALEDDPAWVAQVAAARRAQHDWRPPLGTVESITKITAAEVNNFLQRNLRGGAVWVTLAGPAHPAAVLEFLSSAFGGLRAGRVSLPSAEPAAAKPGEDRIALPGKTRAEIALALPGVPRDHPDHLPLSLLNYILGETGYAGRLGDALVDSGLAYSVYASLEGGRSSGSILIQTATAPADLEAALAAGHAVLDEVSKNGIEEWELQEAKAYRLGRMTFELVSDEALARAFVAQDYAGQSGLDFPGRSAAILALNSERLNQVARSYFSPERLAVGLAGALPAPPKKTPAAKPEKPKEVSLIFRGGNILTLDPARPNVEALAVADGRIVALGSAQEVLALKRPNTQVIDLKGKTLAPSLKDHHLHLLNIGFALLNQERNESLFLDLSAAVSLEEIAQRVTERAAELPAGSWILGTGWSQANWGSQALPTHHVLSQAAPDHPVYLVRVDAHCGWANAAALKAAAISESTPEPAGGTILRLPDGSPSGILLERANELVLTHLPQPSDADVREAFRLGTRALAARGFTEVYDAGFLAFPGIVGLNAPLEGYFELLRQLDSEEPLPLRVNLMVPAPSALAEAVLREPDKFAPSPRLRVTHIKLFADGALGSRGGALSLPYADEPNTRGVFRMTEQDLGHWTHRALVAGLDVATHAIGDAAVARVLDVYQGVLADDESLQPHRLRIEHFSYTPPEEIERAARLGVLLAIQPGFVYPDNQGRTMEDSRLGPERSRDAYAWKRLQDLGAALAGSSDDFTLPTHPLWNVYAAATRKNPSGQPAEGWHPEERLERAAALRLFTKLHSPGGAEHSSGQLSVGAPADLIVLSRNPLAVSETELLELMVHATVRAGQLSFHNGSIVLAPSP